jgi:hypothetical protein
MAASGALNAEGKAGDDRSGHGRERRVHPSGAAELLSVSTNAPRRERACYATLGEGRDEWVFAWGNVNPAGWPIILLP